MVDQAIYQVTFPDTQLQVAAEGVSLPQAKQVMIQAITTFIENNTELVEPQPPEGVEASFGQAGVSQQVEETG